jgi:hypothetical protein
MPIASPALARRAALALLPGLGLAGLATASAAAQTEPAVHLFRIQLARGEVTIGLTPAELAGLGSGPEVSRIARRIAEQGQFTAWRYVVTRAPDGSTQFAARDRVAVMRQEALVVEPYRAALPVTAPPVE